MPLPRQTEQVRLVADAYGLEPSERHALVDRILERQARNVRFWAEFQARPPTAPATTSQIADRLEWSRHELAHLFTHRDRT